MPQFALLSHEFPSPQRGVNHLDLMLEIGPVLWTWRLAEPLQALGKVIAPRIPDHRLAYLDYEGPISNDRGSVHRIDRGPLQILNMTPGNLEVRLDGATFRGTLLLAKQSAGIQSPAEVDDEQLTVGLWSLEWIPQ